MSAPLRATFFALLAVAITAMQNCTIRLAADDGVPSFEIVLFRNVFGLLSVAAIVLWVEHGIPRSRFAGLIGLSCVVHVLSMLTGYYGVAVLPLNESAALGFAMPLFATIGAALFLGETVRARRWSAVAAGFVGVLIILRPGVVPVELGAAMVLVSTMLGAAITLLFKHFAGGERATTLILYQSAFSSLFSIPPAAFVWVTPDAYQMLVMAANGILGTLGWIAFLRACALADASALMPYEFARLPFIAVFAYLLFGETPDEWVWLGAAVIFGSTLYIAHREAAVAREAARRALKAGDPA
ncbi:MAG: DMT family transporter [Alphaproteobacteria bacterium]|nr:DMT family transporter [Alphaproteobacteria bacterium]